MGVEHDGLVIIPMIDRVRSSFDKPKP
jgi:hypothetical protein